MSGATTGNYTFFDRRDGDIDQLEIERLIAEENDPKIRLQLMVMNRINLSLIANTQTVNDVTNTVEKVASRLDAHLTSYEATENQRKGAWRYVAATLGILQAIALIIIADARSSMEAMHKIDEKNSSEIVQIDKRVLLVEQKIK